MSELWLDGILEQNRYGRPRPRERTGTDSLCGRFSCSHRWVPSRMASQTNGLPQSGCCRVRGAVHARLVDRRRHASSASRRKPNLGIAFVSVVLLSLANPLLAKCPTYSVEIRGKIECSFKPDYKVLVTLIYSEHQREASGRDSLGHP